MVGDWGDTRRDGVENRTPVALMDGGVTSPLPGAEVEMIPVVQWVEYFCMQRTFLVAVTTQVPHQRTKFFLRKMGCLGKVTKMEQVRLVGELVNAGTQNI